MKEILIRCWVLGMTGFSVAATQSKMVAFASLEIRLFFDKLSGNDGFLLSREK
jgi:hypothetical protein